MLYLCNPKNLSLNILSLSKIPGLFKACMDHCKQHQTYVLPSSVKGSKKSAAGF